jgi:hypothetical protein
MQATRQGHAPVIQGQYKDTGSRIPGPLLDRVHLHIAFFCFLPFLLPLLLPLLVAASIAVWQAKTIHAIPLLDWNEFPVIEEFRNLSNFLGSSGKGVPG